MQHLHVFLRRHKFFSVRLIGKKYTNKVKEYIMKFEYCVAGIHWCPAHKPLRQILHFDHQLGLYDFFQPIWVANVGLYCSGRLNQREYLFTSARFTFRKQCHRSSLKMILTHILNNLCPSAMSHQSPIELRSCSVYSRSAVGSRDDGDAFLGFVWRALLPRESAPLWHKERPAGPWRSHPRHSTTRLWKILSVRLL